MSVYAAVSDESSDALQQGLLFVGGYSAPLETWRDDLEPAWRDRVLAKAPAIPYLHMTEIRGSRWRERHGLSWHQAESRLDAAVQVIQSTGRLIPVSLSIDQAQCKSFADVMMTLRRKQFARTPLRPAQICYGIFALTQMHYIRTRDPDVEKVHFGVEENGRTTAVLQDAHDALPGALVVIGRPELAPLVGTFEQVRKSDIRAQAADVLCWHARNAHAETLDRDGVRRYLRIAHRFGHYGHVNESVFRDLGAQPREDVIA